MNNIPANRKDVLLKAAYDLLKQQDSSVEYLCLLGEVATYGGEDKTGFQLMDDIAEELNLHE